MVTCTLDVVTKLLVFQQLEGQELSAEDPECVYCQNAMSVVDCI